MNNKTKQLREKIAELEHEQWLQWAGAVIKDLYLISSGHYVDCPCASCVRIRRWKPNMIPYNELDEATKEFDREWAVKDLKVCKEEGLVWKVDREPPHKLPAIPNNEWSAGYACGEEFMQEVMIEVGYTAVEEIDID